MSNGGTTLLSMTYNPDDSVATKTYCNGTVQSYSYNYRGWVSQLQAKYNGTTFEDLVYSYDAKGNVIRIVDLAGTAGTETYTYDYMDRLIKAVGAWGTVQYGYDAVGNRVWVNSGGTNVTYSYGADNKLLSDGTYAYAYDKNGNVIWMNSTSIKYNYVYNALGEMTSIVEWTLSGSTWMSSTIARYYYDANGQRARVISGSSATNCSCMTART